MINTTKIVRFLSLNVALAGIVLISGNFIEADAQGRDPFTKPGWAKTRDNKLGGVGGPKKPAGTVEFGIPSIEQRIAFFKRLREDAAVNGQPLPKVTSVLTLNEMAVTGIFQTPRGYAAMVEATPIKLSYTIYPGEKFFDGQLVAVEENRLVFRRVTKMGKDKFVASVENKILRKYTTQEEIQGTAPSQGEGNGKPPETVATYQPPTGDASAVKPAPAGSIVSPLDEMNKQLPEPDSANQNKKTAKKPVKVAKKGK